MASLVAKTNVINHTSQLYGSLGSTFEVVALGNDKYVVTYGAGNDWNYTAGSGYDIRAEIWNMNGTLAVSHFFIPSIRGGDQQDLSVTETPGGGFTAAWSARLIQSNGAYNTGNLNASDTIRMARFGVDGARIGVEAVFEPGGSLPNWGGVAIAYSDNVDSSFPLVAGSSDSSDIDMIIMSQMAPNFIAQGGVRPNAQFYYQMVEREGPALTISWYERVGGQAFIKGGIINGINQPIHSEWLVPLTTGGSGTASSFYGQDVAYEVTVLASGKTVVGYDDIYGGGDVKFRIFNQDGTGGGTPLLVSIDESTEALTAGEEGISIHALNDGGFVAVWKQLGYTNAAGQLVPTGLYMRVYDDLGIPSGVAVLVKQETSSTSYLDIDIDVSDNGGIVVGWIEYSSNSGVGGTYSRVFRLESAVDGTSGNDVLISTTASTAFSGLEGFDFVSYAQAPVGLSASLDLPSSNTGQAAGDSYNSIEGLMGSSFDDILTGSGGNDALQGLGGNDRLAGGTGSDTLDGGEGDDWIVYDAADTAANVNGGNGSDTLVIIGGAVPTAYNLAARGFESARHDITDTTNQSWSTISDTYNTAWQRLTSDIRLDNGTRQVRTFDHLGNQSYSEFINQYLDLANANAITKQFIAFDSGTKQERFFDYLNNQSYSEYTNDYLDVANSGAVTRQIILADAGTKQERFFDYLGNQSYLEYINDYADAAQPGSVTRQVIFFDNGTRQERFFDYLNNQPAYSEYINFYNVAGQITRQVGFSNSGAQAWEYFY